MKRPSYIATAVAALALCVVVGLAGCGQAPSQTQQPVQEQPAAEQVTQEKAKSEQSTTDEKANEQTGEKAGAIPADGTYEIQADTDSSMFRSEKCVLTVKDGACTAELTLPGEGFSKLFFGSAADAQNAPEDQVYEYRLNDKGKYTFDVPVSKLDEELSIAAFGHRRDTWYDHTITFHAPK